MTFSKGTWPNIIGFLLTRLVIPLWVLSGAVFKLLEKSPRTLPKATFLDPASQYDIDLYLLLAILISLEFFAIFVMIIMKRFARTMAIAVLSCFCLVLLNEIRGGASSCGCLGSFSPPPWVMLSIDGFLLLGTIFFAPSKAIPLFSFKPQFVAVLSGTLLGTAVSFGVVIPAGRVPKPEPTENNVVRPNGINDPTINPAPKPLKGYWVVEDIEDWIGKSWRELELFQFMPKWPENMDKGIRYIVFYSRTCEHCEEMFWDDLTKPLNPPVITIEIPADKETLRSPNSWEMPETNCVFMNLPVGTDWIISSP